MRRAQRRSRPEDAASTCVYGPSPPTLPIRPTPTDYPHYPQIIHGAYGRPVLECTGVIALETLREQAARAFDAGVGRDAEADRREVEKLHAKIGQLTVERDFLAKRSGR